jgi:hypothetical protein
VTGSRYEYVIDRNDVITEVSEEWARFAAENDAAELPGRTVGSWLWQHLAGREVKHLYRSLLERVRDQGTTVELPFRCDSPTKRRFMRLRAVPLPGNAVRFVTSLTREEERPPERILEREATRSEGPPLAMCAWCKRVQDELGGWQEIEAALASMPIFVRDTPPRIQHGVCEDCRRAALEAMWREGAE